MSRLLAIGLFGACCFLAGLTLSPGGVVTAQTSAQAQPAAPQAIDGKGVFFSSEDIQRLFPPADKKGDLPPSSISNYLAWDPYYRFTVRRRPYFDPARKNEATGEMLRYAGSEMHENKTQIYVMSGGTGAVVLGGKPAKERPGPIVDGQYSGGMLAGGTSYRGEGWGLDCHSANDMAPGAAGSRPDADVRDVPYRDEAVDAVGHRIHTQHLKR